MTAIGKIRQNWTVRDDNIEMVNEIAYLGTKVNNTNDVKHGTRYRITKEKGKA